MPGIARWSSHGPRQFRTDQEMLTLALLAYRGFWDPDPANRGSLVALFRAGLDALEPLRGRWELVWGPATYRYPGSLFDDSLMYVVGAAGPEPRYAVVVRGTNALAALDWVLGDFLAGYQLPWRPGGREPARGAKVSLSMALGLKILLNMRAASQPGWESSGLLPEFVKDWGGAIWSNGFHAWRALRERLPLGISRRRIGGPWLQVLASTPSLRLDPSESDLGKRVDLLRVGSSELGRIFGALGDEAADALVSSLLESGGRLGSTLGAGTGLLDQLNTLTEKHPQGFDLLVTGHSKGGALAPVLALHLADTRGIGSVAPEHRWDPEGISRIHCYSFAAPTAGNGAFAEHSDAVIGERCYRVANSRDFVTHAWLPEQLREVAHIYVPISTPPPGLDSLLDLVAEQVEPLDYKHVGKHVTDFRGSLNPSIKLFFEQEIFQHVQGYIDALELTDVIDVRDLIADWKALGA